VRRFNRWLLAATAVALLLIGACRSGDRDRTTILIGLDGFRWDYRDKVETPVLDELAASGVVSNLRPSYPSKTFPSHHTIATGLHPNRHGVVGNTTYDPELDIRFSMGADGAPADGRWWGGEPIWVTVEKAGLIAATHFWPGTEAEIDGVRPTHWKPYDGGVTGPERVRQILEWLDLPEAERPKFLTLYFSDVDGAGHYHGPDSEETIQAVERVDGYLGILLKGLDDRGLRDRVNLVVAADHGMVQLARDRVVYLDDYIEPDRAGILSLGQHVALWPADEDLEQVFQALDGAHPALQVFRRGSMPERLHVDGSPRTPPIVGLVEEGWSVSTRSYVERRENAFTGGGHGYDNMVPNMAGIFVASGPAFKRGALVGTIDAVDVYNLLAEAVGVKPAQNQGSIEVAKQIMK
jgi:predicted AlkP superfamily pyrophosphatase or phosphodiesterase